MPVLPHEVSLGRLVRCKDRDAFTCLYDTYAPAVFGEILRTVNNRQAAENLLHDVFIAIWQKSDEFNPEKERLFTWILLNTRKICNDHL